MASNCPQWLKNAIFYHIYLPCFYDSNDDGIGDIQGVSQKLDYVESIGCNAIWISPCFVSPFRDAGYDIADYYKIAPRYGTNSDMKRLFLEAKHRGIRICLDIVPGHTSIDHPWFKSSCSASTNKYTNWYIWTKTIWDRFDEGAAVVRGFAERDGNFYSNFFYHQPSLNYGFRKPDPSKPWQLPTNHPDVIAVKKEMIKIMRFWLDMGASGFRVDMANSLVKEDSEGKATSQFWRQVRSIFDEYYPDAVLISEWANAAQAIRAGFHASFMLPWGNPSCVTMFYKETYRNVHANSFGHSFFDKNGEGDVSEFFKDYLKHYNKIRSKGYIAPTTGSHDIFRISMGRTKKEIELIFVFILTMPGVPFIYYGDEIGMRYVDNLVSKEGGYNRTGSRTPMRWNTSRNAGFSNAPSKKLYLPVKKQKTSPDVSRQEIIRNSLLNRVRFLINLRKTNIALCANGEFVLLYAKKNKYPLIYLRKYKKQKILIAINPSAKFVEAEVNILANNLKREILAGYGVELALEGKNIKLRMKGISYGIFHI